MNISRKDFIQQGIFTFGRSIAESFRGEPSADVTATGTEEYPYLRLHNSRCLAQQGGCFSCIDHCPREAVTIAPGVGVAIAAALCDGCGQCALVCPVSPKAIELKPHKQPALTLT
jgi:Pyruvate/2-oxoacid:ferredoxin oxidoreductase delta subunit